jgi:hypothetical protein
MQYEQAVTLSEAGEPKENIRGHGPFRLHDRFTLGSRRCRSERIHDLRFRSGPARGGL